MTEVGGPTQQPQLGALSSVMKAGASLVRGASEKLSKLADSVQRLYDKHCSTVDIEVVHGGKLQILCLTKAEAYRLHCKIEGSDVDSKSYGEMRKESQSHDSDALKRKIESKIEGGEIDFEDINVAKKKDLCRYVFDEIVTNMNTLVSMDYLEPGSMTDDQFKARAGSILSRGLDKLPEDQYEKLRKKMQGSDDVVIKELSKYIPSK